MEWGTGTGAPSGSARLPGATGCAADAWALRPGQGARGCAAFCARRAAEPQVVADLTADTFVAAITSFGSFDPRKGTARSWVFGIARRVYASSCERYSQHQHRLQRLAGRRELDQDQ